MKIKVEKFIKYIKKLFTLECPDCKGKMKSEFIDMEIDKVVYKCEKCGKEWF